MFTKFNAGSFLACYSDTLRCLVVFQIKTKKQTPKNTRGKFWGKNQGGIEGEKKSKGK